MKELRRIDRDTFKTLLDLGMPVYATTIGHPHLSQYSQREIFSDLCSEPMSNWMRHARVVWKEKIDDPTYVKTFFTVVDTDEETKSE